MPQAGGEPASYRFGRFRVDARERRLLEDGARVHLAPRAFDTLLRLVRSAGSVVTREELLADVWGGSVVEEGNLSNVVWILRRAVGETAIETVPKTGYRFVAPVVPSAGDEMPASQTVLAVLPFRTLAGSEPEPALEQGLADLLITRLSTVPDLVVRPLRSVLQFANEEDPVAAGRAVGAGAVVDASLRTTPGQVRVNVRLLRVADGLSLWAESLVVQRAELLDLEDQLARSLARALAPRLSAGRRARLNLSATSHPQALELYLHGRYNWQRREPSALARALEHFSRAVELDPRFALAWAGIADVHGVRSMVCDARPADCFDPARSAIAHALEIDPELAEAHGAAGMVSFWHEWNWESAEDSLRRALESSPSLLSAHLFLAHLRSNTGRHAEALSGIDFTCTLDPYSALPQTLRGIFLVHARRFTEALARFDETLAAEPDFWVARLNRGKLLLFLGRLDDAAADLELCEQRNPMSAQATSMLVAVAVRRGDRAAARNRLQALEARARERWVPPTDLVIARLACGVDGALDGLDLAYAERDPRLSFLGVDPKWDALAADPRVVAMRRQMRLPAGIESGS